jgi:hypothetical protein
VSATPIVPVQRAPFASTRPNRHHSRRWIEAKGWSWRTDTAGSPCPAGVRSMKPNASRESHNRGPVKPVNSSPLAIAREPSSCSAEGAGLGVGVVGGTSEAAQPAPAPGVGRRPAAPPPPKSGQPCAPSTSTSTTTSPTPASASPRENLTHAPETKSVRDQGSLGNESALRPARVVMRHMRQAR